MTPFDHRPAPGQRQVVYGQVSSRQPAPAGFDDPLHVVIPDYDPNIVYTCVTWPVMHGGTLPAQGASCLLIQDDQHQWWCAAWVGQYSPPPLAIHADTAGSIG